jgi:type II secretory pathway component PulF
MNVGTNPTTFASSASATHTWRRILLKISNALLNLGLVAVGILVAIIYGRISLWQNDQNLCPTLWRDCINLPILSQSEDCMATVTMVVLC